MFGSRAYRRAVHGEWFDDDEPPRNGPLQWILWGLIIATIVYYSFFAK